MQKLSLLLALVFMVKFCAAQNAGATNDTTRQYIPIEGKSENGVPKSLMGSWTLVSGIQPRSNAAVKEKFQIKKKNTGTDNNIDSITTSSTVNGITRTETEVSIRRTVAPDNDITPAQGNKMHKEAKPSINFFGANETYSGYTGCNKFSGRYTIAGNSISFSEAAPSTKMTCLGNMTKMNFSKH